MHCKELDEYRKFAKPGEVDKAVNTLKGIVDGIVADGIIAPDEMQELTNWCVLHQHLADRHPFSDIFPVIQGALSDGVVTEDEIEDILWVCNSCAQDSPYYDFLTATVQSLEGQLQGFLADGVLSDDEIRILHEWLNENDFLAGTYPYDEVSSLLTAALQDGKISDDERNMLVAYFGNFVDTSLSMHINSTDLEKLREQYSVCGICACCPEIEIAGKTFCFTGTSEFTTRDEIAEIITSHGGFFHNSVTQKTDYLIVGNSGNPCWAFACYGRKVEKAITMRKQGSKVMIVNERDFWDTMQDLG